MTINELSMQYEKIMEDLRFIRQNGDHDQSVEPEETALKLVAQKILAQRHTVGGSVSARPVAVDDR